MDVCWKREKLTRPNITTFKQNSSTSFMSILTLPLVDEDLGLDLDMIERMDGDVCGTRKTSGSTAPEIESDQAFTDEFRA
ncbi:uncharacterized protein KD926_000889 [Aspergillus affinis]|uniref:uncharacterized protein n=1 Tax=Aspergillus affinis TaxID=1070780 RepID=UPI0022FE4032|nr:uncharacterized protein KD926_000889 [Aspergillus affinis]KAI9037022.1 hypothetical protein KD926_000889 [Aspergillus affinis]